MAMEAYQKTVSGHWLVDLTLLRHHFAQIRQLKNCILTSQRKPEILVHQNLKMCRQEIKFV